MNNEYSTFEAERAAEIEAEKEYTEIPVGFRSLQGTGDVVAITNQTDGPWRVYVIAHETDYSIHEARRLAADIISAADSAAAMSAPKVHDSSINGRNLLMIPLHGDDKAISELTRGPRRIVRMEHGESHVSYFAQRPNDDRSGDLRPGETWIEREGRGKHKSVTKFTYMGTFEMILNATETQGMVLLAEVPVSEVP